MTRIDPSSRLAEAIRRQMEAMRDARGMARGGAHGPASAPAGDASRPSSEASMARRIGAIDAHDPHRRRKAFRIFLESVLLTEMGDSLINDAGFYELVERIQDQMASDPSLAKAMDEAGEQLLVLGPAHR